MSNQKTTANKTPEATMLLSSSCAFCPSVLESLMKMIKSGELSNLQVINLEQNPEAMQQYKVRSVPWVRIGKHELTGSQTLEALQQRAQWAKDEESLVADFDFLLSDGQVDKVIQALQKDESGFSAIMELLGDTGTVLSTRIGIGVIFEEFAGSDVVKSLTPKLGELSKHETAESVQMPFITWA
ncbi:MAG: thioredoxin family protein [Cocleimonas sp.]|nr:thioredoxin family protein [Cocleimonas sp.]